MSATSSNNPGSKRKKVLTVAVATIIAALIAAGAAIYLHGSPASRSSSNNGGNNNQANGNNNGCGVIQGNGNRCAPQQNPKDDPSQYWNSAPPTGSGPWPYAVVNTVMNNGTDIGLVVRSCDRSNCGCSTSQCERLGAARGLSTVYAICKETTDFAAGTSDPPIWIRIKWPNNVGGTLKVFNSSPNDPYTGWAFSAYLGPKGHNGNIPKCG
jgi:hypothetical protein